MVAKSNLPKILIDSDVIRHFMKGEVLLRLPNIFPNRIIVLENVRSEICRSAHLAGQMAMFLSVKGVELQQFPKDQQILVEYAKLLKEGLGVGESSCLAVARYKNNIIASSNLRDIHNYCTEHDIEYVTTMDVLIEAERVGVFSEIECNQIIQKILDKRSKLPCSTLAEYKKKIKPN